MKKFKPFNENEEVKNEDVSMQDVFAGKTKLAEDVEMTHGGAEDNEAVIVNP